MTLTRKNNILAILMMLGLPFHAQAETKPAAPSWPAEKPGAYIAPSAGGVAPGATPAFAISVGDIENGKRIPDPYVYCVPQGGRHGEGQNINPAVSWANAPAKTASFALIMVDEDVPTNFDTANKDGQGIPATLPRRAFYHWLVVDIPPSATGITKGQDSAGRDAKKAGKQAYGITGVNDYPAQPPRGGYDGSCPPWNDELLHHYHFRIYALDVPTLGLPEGFHGADVMKAMEGHILASAEVTGTYATNPAVK